MSTMSKIAAVVTAGLGAMIAAPSHAAAPVEYVKVCSLYGAGFFYKPGTDNTFHIGHSRLAANALLVQRGKVMVRLEGGFAKATATAIARTLGR